MINEWLEEYNIKSDEDLVFAKREIMQEIVLAGLAREGFFKHATFYGGTALRLFHKLDRYSEDLDFSLNYVDEHFTLEPFLKGISNEFVLLGLEVEISIKKKVAISSVESAFLKDKSVWGYISISDKQKVNNSLPTVKIKIEVDRTPPLNFETEQLLLTKPYTFYVSCMCLESLFAGKMHAVLFRAWRNRVKGRDWYDLEWYIKKGIPLRLDEFTNRAQNSFHYPMNDNKMPEVTFQNLMYDRIEGLDIASAKFDVQSFILEPNDLQIWSKHYFHDLVKLIKIV